MEFGFIGTGAMVSAIVRGAARSGMDMSQVGLYDLNADAARALARQVGATAVEWPSDIAKQARFIVLGVKPHVQTAVIKGIDEDVASRRNVTVVSIAAGRSLDAIAADFSSEVGIIRVMPNVNAQVGQAMTALTRNAYATDGDLAAARELFDAVGSTVALAEKDFSAFTALAGSSPAWFFQIVDALARAGVKHGLPKDLAVAIAGQAMLGSATTLMQRAEKGDIPQKLVDEVSSPGGTTIAGSLAAEEAGLGPALVAAVDACIARDQEMGA